HDLFIYPHLRRAGQPWLLDAPVAPRNAEALLVAGQTDVSRALDAQGIPLLAAARTLPETTAIIVADVHTLELLGNPQRASWTMVGLLGASLLCVALLVLFRANLKAGR